MGNRDKESREVLDIGGKLNFVMLLLIAVALVAYGVWIFIEMSAWERGDGGSSIRVPRILYFLVNIGESVIEGSGKWLLSGLMILAGVTLGYNTLSSDNEKKNEGSEE